MNRPVSPAVAERAVEWLVELQSAQAGPQTRAQWQQWLGEDPSHQQAWQRIEAFSQRLDTLHSGSQNTLMYATLAPRLSRRRALKSLALLIAAGGAAWAARDTQWAWQFRSDYRSGVGEQRSITLADGTHVQLNTDTSLEAQFDQHQRLVVLHSGEILLSCAPDALNRPFTVKTAQGQCHATTAGTRFSVRQLAGISRVSAYNEALNVVPEAGHIARLRSGQSAWFDQLSVHDAGPARERELAWTQGMVVADNQRLEDFLDNLARYRNGHLGCDREVAELRISGTYPLADTDRVLTTVSKTLQLDIRQFTRFWTTLGPRSGTA